VSRGGMADDDDIDDDEEGSTDDIATAPNENADPPEIVKGGEPVRYRRWR